MLVLISRFSVQLPGAVKSSGEYFKDLKLAVISPRFVFVLGNVIVIALLVKSGQFSGHGSAEKNDFYNEFVEKSERLNHSVQPRVESDFQDKQVILEKVVPCKDVSSPRCLSATETAYRRSQSEKLNHPQYEKQKPDRELRRSATENCMKRPDCSGKLSVKGPFPEDSMSNEEFRRTIEAFIARQQRFLRDEEDYVM